MENKNSLGSTYVDGVDGAFVNGTPGSEDSQALQPAPQQPGTTNVASAARKKRLSPFTIAILAAIFLMATGFMVWMLWPASNNASQSARFENTQVDLSDVASQGNNFSTASELTVFGQLNLAGNFAIVPSAQPANPKAGQLYYDQATNLLNYYNGTGFVGLSGQQELQVGAGLTNTDGILANSGVLSVQGLSGDIALTAGDGITIAGTTISANVTNNGVLSLASGSPSLTINSDGNGNLTITSSGGGTGNVQTAGGTAGRLAVFTGVDTIADSIVSESGATLSVDGALTTTGSINGQTISSSANFTGTVTVANNLTLTTGDLAVNGGDITSTGGLVVTAAGGNITVNANGTIALQDSTNITGNLGVSGALTLGTPLGVPSGGTGASSFSINGVLIGQGAGAIAAVTAGGSGMCLKSTGGAPAFDPCVVNTAAVTDLNSLTGSLTIANATGLVDTITIDDASTAQKGIAQFNATNFTAASGNINTAQNIHSGATPTFAGLTLNGALNMGANNITGSNFSVQGSSGNLTTSGTVSSGLINGQTISSSANFTGSATVANGLTLTAGDLAVNGGNITGTGALAVTGGSTLTLATTGSSDLSLQTNGSTRLTVAGSGGDLLATGNITLQGGTVTVGTTTQAGTLVLHDGDGETATIEIDLSGLGSNQSYTLPDASGVICLDTGNCAGSGSGVTSAGGGSTNRLAKFTASQNIEDSTITDDGTNVTTTVDVIVQGGDLTVGTTSQLASLVLHDGNGQNTTLQAGDSTGDLTFVLPTNAGSANQCLKQSGTGNQLVWDACDGGGGGVSTTLQNAYINGNSITTSDARDIDIVLANTATDSNLDIIVADGSTSFV